MDTPQRGYTLVKHDNDNLYDLTLAQKMSGLESFALTCGGGWPPEKWLGWLRQEATP